MCYQLLAEFFFPHQCRPIKLLTSDFTLSCSGPVKIAQSCHHVLAAQFSICSTDKRSTQTFTQVWFTSGSSSFIRPPAWPSSMEASFMVSPGRGQCHFTCKVAGCSVGEKLEMSNASLERSCDPPHKQLLYFICVSFISGNVLAETSSMLLWVCCHSSSSFLFRLVIFSIEGWVAGWGSLLAQGSSEDTHKRKTLLLLSEGGQCCLLSSAGTQVFLILSLVWFSNPACVCLIIFSAFRFVFSSPHVAVRVKRNPVNSNLIWFQPLLVF